MGCDDTTQVKRLPDLITFSILERIEWAATVLPRKVDKVLDDFQYPRTDRMGCDVSNVPSIWSDEPLSVSSNGSNGLRRGADGVQHVFRAAFSILERIEWAATPGHADAAAAARTFQYPRTDRMGCDVTILFLLGQLAVLSVSSNGSNGLRLE